MLNIPILSVIPEDTKIADAITRRVPVVHLHSRSGAAAGYKKLASSVMGEKFPRQPGIINALVDFFEEED